MVKTQRRSELDPLDPDIARLSAELAISAEAMGLVELPNSPITFDRGKLNHLLRTLAKEGIARKPIGEFFSEGTRDRDAIVRLLNGLATVLEESPLPGHEWDGLLQIFPSDDLARLLNVSPSSLARYAKGQRATPDEVAERLHFVARVVGDLKGTYNDLGIRRWFVRPRSKLRGKAPAQHLRGDWLPGHAGPQAIRELARSLVLTAAT